MLISARNPNGSRGDSGAHYASLEPHLACLNTGHAIPGHHYNHACFDDSPPICHDLAGSSMMAPAAEVLTSALLSLRHS